MWDVFEIKVKILILSHLIHYYLYPIGIPRARKLKIDDLKRPKILWYCHNVSIDKSHRTRWGSLQTVIFHSFNYWKFRKCLPNIQISYKIVFFNATSKNILAPLGHFFGWRIETRLIICFTPFNGVQNR